MTYEKYIRMNDKLASGIIRVQEEIFCIDNRTAVINSLIGIGISCIDLLFQNPNLTGLKK